MNLLTEKILNKITDGKRVSEEEGLQLLLNTDLLTLGKLADSVRRRIHSEPIVTFIVDRNINYTNICLNKCKFCAFYRDEEAKDAYVLDKETIFEKIDELVAQDGTQILLQGGLHPHLDINFYEDLLNAIKDKYNINIHGFSSPEIIHIAKLSGLSIKETLARLKESGLDSIPGGGAEILVDRVRNLISPNKIGWAKWMEVMETAHNLGMPTTATMMFGNIETKEEIIQHMIRVRDLQDKTHGFTAFIPWTFQPQNTELGGHKATGVEYLKVLAISRIMLDNVKNIQASWVTQGSKIAQIALKFGANDLGSTMLEENVVAAAGITFRMNQQEIIHIIKDAGYIPAQRNTVYKILKCFRKCS